MAWVATMNQDLWELPVPSTALTRGPNFRELAKRNCELEYYVETEDGGDRREAVIFEGVEAYKCTYLTALTVEMIKTAYDKIVRISPSQWLAEVKRSNALFYQNLPQAPKEPQHLMICFDDGPCYEFICIDFKTP